MQFEFEAKQFTDPEVMASAYLSRYFENQKIEYPINPFKMLKDAGILFSLMDFKKLEGVYIPADSNEDIPVVGINVNRPITRQRFTAAHELCHHYRDADKNISCPISGKKTGIELFADKFAAALLMPMQELRHQVNKRKNTRGNVSFDLADALYGNFPDYLQHPLSPHGEFVSGSMLPSCAVLASSPVQQFPQIRSWPEP